MNVLADKAHKQGMPHSDNALHNMATSFNNHPYISSSGISKYIHWFVPTSARFLFINLFMEAYFFSMHKIVLVSLTHPWLIARYCVGGSMLNQNGVYRPLAVGVVLTCSGRHVGVHKCDYPVRVCAAGLCVWSRRFLCVCMYVCIYVCMYVYVDKKTSCLGSYHRKISR